MRLKSNGTKNQARTSKARLGEFPKTFLAEVFIIHT